MGHGVMRRPDENVSETTHRKEKDGKPREENDRLGSYEPREKGGRPFLVSPSDMSFRMQQTCGPADPPRAYVPNRGAGLEAGPDRARGGLCALRLPLRGAPARGGSYTVVMTPRGK